MDTLGRIKLLPEILEDKIFLFIPRRNHIRQLKHKFNYMEAINSHLLFRDQVEEYLDQHVHGLHNTYKYFDYVNHNYDKPPPHRPSLIRLLEEIGDDYPHKYINN